MYKNSAAAAQTGRSPAQTGKASDDMFLTLKNELLTLAIKPGQLIREDETCARFNASRPTVRAVFQRLADAGLTDLFPYRGVYASLIDLDLVRQLIHLRIITETRIMTDFITQNPDPMIIEDIEHNIRRQEIMMSRPSFPQQNFWHSTAACTCCGLMNAGAPVYGHFCSSRIFTTHVLNCST